MIPYRKLLPVVLLFVSPAVWAQAPAVGRLLVSTPQQDDPSFAESVVLLLVHENNSSAGIFLNRPTWVEPTEAFPDVDGLEAYTEALFLGGPVAPNQILMLFEYDGVPPVDARNLFGNIHFSATTEPLANLDLTSEGAPRIRLYAGYAQWGPGQLEAEIEAGDWRVLEAQASFVFSSDPASMWQRMPPSSSGVSAALSPIQSFSIE